MTLPLLADWTDNGTIITRSGVSGQHDFTLNGSISPGEIVKVGNQYITYVVAGSDYRTLDPTEPAYRRVLAYTSPDMATWTRHPTSIVENFPNNDEEEGGFSVGATVDNGTVLLYYSQLEGVGGQVTGDIYLKTGTDGLNFGAPTLIFDHADSSIAGNSTDGDEMFPVGAYKNNSQYYLYYITSRAGSSAWQLYLATADSPTGFVGANTQLIINNSTARVVGGVNPTLHNGLLYIFCTRTPNWTDYYTDVFSADPATPQTLTLADTWNLAGVFHQGVYNEGDAWRMIYMDSAAPTTNIGMMSVGTITGGSTMAFPSLNSATNKSKSIVLEDVTRTAKTIKDAAQALHDESAAGPVGANKILNFLTRLADAKDQFDTMVGTTGIDAFAQTYFDNVALTISNEHTTLDVTLVSLRDWIITSFPGSAGGIHEKKFDVNGRQTINQWSSTATAGLRTELLAFIATID